MNITFKTLFGIDASEIQKTCVIMPFDIPGAAKQLGVASMKKGNCFSTGQGKDLTLIRSGMSACFVGDSVLWLQHTPCERIIFLGTCGLIARTDKLDIGTVLTPEKIYAFESFSAIVTDNIETPEPLTADTSLIEAMKLDIPRCGCISFASLHEETRFMPLFQELKAEVIEMECSAFFLASRNIMRPCSALLIASDIVGDKTLCFDLSPKNKKSLANGISQACKHIKKSC